jgi:hypothetical protein
MAGHLAENVPSSPGSAMSEVLHHSPQEFWRAPAAHPETENALPLPACGSCGTEFIIGARFCHTCGASPVLHGHRPAESLKFPEQLEFHNLQNWFGLSTLSLAAFLIGIGCVLATIGVGFLYSAQTIADFQAIQLWRIEWLLGAVAAFAAGILLKRSGTAEK